MNSGSGQRQYAYMKIVKRSKCYRQKRKLGACPSFDPQAPMMGQVFFTCDNKWLGCEYGSPYIAISKTEYCFW